MSLPPRTVRRLGGAAAAVVLATTACTTQVTGAGRPAAQRPATASTSASPSGSGGVPSGSGGVPSGAPVPGGARYPESTPAVRSYLYARDTTFSELYASAAGTFSDNGVAITVDARFGNDAAANLAGSCTLTAGGVTAQVVGGVPSPGADSVVVAQAPAAFWTALGYDATVAAQAAGQWATVTNLSGPVGGCGNLVFFLGVFEPQDSDQIVTGTENGGSSYVVTDTTNGYATVIDHDSGLITAIRSTAGGTVELTFPGDRTPIASLPAGIVSVPGL